MTMANLKKQLPGDSKKTGKGVDKNIMHAKSNGNSNARVACVQWQMRNFSSIEDFLQHVENYVRSLAAYKCDVVLFPEFFNVPLTGLTLQLEPMAAMRELALHTPTLLEKIAAMAVKYRINVAAGSLPVLERKTLYNVAYFCHRDGGRDEQYKLHPTPGEKRDWDIRGGNTLHAF